MPVTIDEVKPGLLRSDSQTFEGDIYPADVTTFVTADYPELTARLSAYSRGIQDPHRLAGNYLDYDFSTSEFATMYTVEDNIVGFSTGWARDFYPAGSIRILNRFYQDPKQLRVKYIRNFLRPTTEAAVRQQVILAQRLGFATAFISRELRTTKYFSEFAAALNANTEYDWEHQTGPFLVAPDPSNPGCWQSIIRTCFDSEKPFWNHWRTK